MSSSDLDGSDNEDSKKVVSDSDSDSVDKKTRKAKTGARQVIESDGSDESNSEKSSSSDSSDSDDDDRPAPSSTSKTAASKRKAPAKKAAPTIKRKKAKNSDDEEPEEWYESIEDKKRLDLLTEKEREQEIFNRMEQAELRKTREQIEQKLAAKNKLKDGSPSKKKKRVASSDDNDSDSDASEKSSASVKKSQYSSDSEELDAKFHRPSEVESKNKRKSAMHDLIAKRKDKERKHKEAKKTALSYDAVFGKDDEDKGNDSSSTSSSSASSRSSSSSRDSSPDRASDDEKDAEKKKPIEHVEQLQRMKISRHKLSLMVHRPAFEKTVVGCFVRVGTGPMPGSKLKYRMCQITEVTVGPKVYTLEKTKTNKVLKLKLPRSADRPFRMEYVSNDKIRPEEWDEFRRFCSESVLTMPTLEQMEKKEGDVKTLITTRMTDTEVQAIVESKGKVMNTHKNFAMTKGGLLKRKEAAEQTGDMEEAQRCQREIDEIDQRAEHEEKERSKSIQGISWINQRNRNQMKESFLGDATKNADMSLGDDPFTRKKDRMKVVSGAKGNPNDKDNSAGSSEQQKEDTNSGVPKVMHISKSANDLFNLHASIRPSTALDIDLSRLRSSAITSKTEDTSMDSQSSSVNTPPSANRRTVSLEDYRRRRLAQAAGNA